MTHRPTPPETSALRTHTHAKSNGKRLYASFINAPNGPPKTAFTYGTFSTNLVMARAHAGDGANIGATPLRKLLKVVDMMQDPDIEDHLASLARAFCEHMWSACSVVQGVMDSRDAFEL